VLVPYFLLFLCFKKVTREIFSELDETKAEHPDIYRSFQKSEEETEGGHWAATPPGAWPTDAGRMTTQLGTPRGRYDEYSSKFSLSKKLRFSDTVGKS
jgi:hypothetical protein